MVGATLPLLWFRRSCALSEPILCICQDRRCPRSGRYQGPMPFGALVIASMTILPCSLLLVVILIPQRRTWSRRKLEPPRGNYKGMPRTGTDYKKDRFKDLSKLGNHPRTDSIIFPAGLPSTRGLPFLELSLLGPWIPLLSFGRCHRILSLPFFVEPQRVPRDSLKQSSRSELSHRLFRCLA